MANATSPKPGTPGGKAGENTQPIERSAEEARQARRGFHVFYILGISLTLIVIAYIIIYFVGV